MSISGPTSSRSSSQDSLGMGMGQSDAARKIQQAFRRHMETKQQKNAVNIIENSYRRYKSNQEVKKEAEVSESQNT